MARLLKKNGETGPSMCLLAHQQRVLNWSGVDLQFELFEEALDVAAGLCVAKTRHVHESKGGEESLSNISILEIQHRDLGP